jgi:hypothetical protein
MWRANKYVIMICLLALSFVHWARSQTAPAEDENIPYLVTFGGDSETSWGDDDFCQIFFFLVPVSYNAPFYIQVFDPDTGGELDEMKGDFNTSVRYSVYGGAGAWSHEDARNTDPVGHYESGNLLDSKNFAQSGRFDQQWYTFGPFHQKEGEYVDKFGGYVFKVIAKGLSGDDGNLYRYAMSTEKDEYRPVEGGNIFTYEYTFRLSNNQNNVSQIYPYIDDKVTSVKIQNYDWDNDGFIRVVSLARRGELLTTSNEDEWQMNSLEIEEKERNTSMEMQFIKNNRQLIRNNNVVVVVQNQYGESLPFYVIPIGGRPVYRSTIRVKVMEKK